MRRRGEREAGWPCPVMCGEFAESTNPMIGRYGPYNLRQIHADWAGRHMKHRMLAMAAVALCGSACSTPGSTTSEAVSKIQTGMSRAEVIRLLGQPQNRSVRDDIEVLQYCQTGLGADAAVAVWLAKGVVTSFGQDQMRLGLQFSCTERSPRVDWPDDD